MVLTAVQTCGSALEFAPEALRADREVALRAVQQDAYALQLAADEVLEDPSFGTEAKREYHLLK
eukprot:1589016-Amphidinium_carterae.1